MLGCKGLKVLKQKIYFYYNQLAWSKVIVMSNTLQYSVCSLNMPKKILKKIFFHNCCLGNFHGCYLKQYVALTWVMLSRS